MRPITVTLWILVPLAAAITPVTAGANICDDIDDVSTGWDAVANALEETAGEDVGDLDVDRLEQDVNTLLEPTQVLADALADSADPDEVELGEDLLDMIDGIYDTDGEDLADYLVDRIDDLVDTLDDVVDFCDEVHE